MKLNHIIGWFLIISIIFILILCIVNIDTYSIEKPVHKSLPPINVTEYSYVDESYNASTDDGSFSAGGGHGVCTSSSASCIRGTCHVKIKTWCDNETLELERVRLGIYR